MLHKIVHADCPWDWESWGEPGTRSPSAHYDLMPTPEICAYWHESDLDSVVSRDAWLVMWATFPRLPDALQVIHAWGFTYSTGLPWVKCRRFATCDCGAALAPEPVNGLSYLISGDTELILIARRGNPKVIAPQSGLLLEFSDVQWAELAWALFTERRQHSRKPDEIYRLCEAAFPGPGLDLFSRRSERPGWTLMGNEVGKFHE